MFIIVKVHAGLSLDRNYREKINDLYYIELVSAMKFRFYCVIIDCQEVVVNKSISKIKLFNGCSRLIILVVFVVSVVYVASRSVAFSRMRIVNLIIRYVLADVLYVTCPSYIDRRKRCVLALKSFSKRNNKMTQ